jgi:hypothetical protein
MAGGRVDAGEYCEPALQMHGDNIGPISATP